MKQLTFSAAIAALLFTVFTMFAVSCDRIRPNIGGVDSVQVDQQIDAYMNPSFATPADIIEYQQETAEELNIQSTFLDMPQAVIVNVATMCINKYGCVTVHKLVEEYLANKDVFDNLASPVPATSQPKNDPTVVEEPQTLVVDSGAKKLKATQIDTIINGQKVQLIKYESNG